MFYITISRENWNFGPHESALAKKWWLSNALSPFKKRDFERKTSHKADNWLLKLVIG